MVNQEPTLIKLPEKESGTSEIGAEKNILPREMEYLAFNGRFAAVYESFRRIPENQRGNYDNKYILYAVIRGGIEKIKKIAATGETVQVDQERALIEAFLKIFISSCTETKIYTRELFECILDWTELLNQLSFSGNALYYYDEAIRLGIHKFPELYSMLMLRKAENLFSLGKHAEARSILSQLAEKYYLIPDWNLISRIFFLLGSSSLLTGESGNYKQLLFRGLRHFYTDLEMRRLFFDQLLKTYRKFYRILFDGKIDFGNKFLASVHLLAFSASGVPFFEKIKLGRMAVFLMLGYVYFCNYVRGGAAGNLSRRGTETQAAAANMPAGKVTREKKNILITRAMGGIGDLLMMTPGLHALKLNFPDEEIHLAVPQQFFQLFFGNPDIKIVDINKDLNPGMFRKWFNLTDCPAARVESRTAPYVRANRIDIFARAMGISGSSFRAMDRNPRYFVTEEEKKFREEFWKDRGLKGKAVTGVQFRAAELYKSYPYTEELVRELSRESVVLLFHSEPITGCDFENVIRVDSYSLRKAFALVKGCDVIVAPDSSFVHLSAALGTPCVLLSGPVDGKLRSVHYPLNVYIDVRSRLKCLPCWRNENMSCALTGLRSSACMSNIGIPEILDAIKLARKTKEK